LHWRLKSVAVDNGCSLNAEIVQRLRRSFDGGVRDTAVLAAAQDIYNHAPPPYNAGTCW
jgi:hypothetical protein